MKHIKALLDAKEIKITWEFDEAQADAVHNQFSLEKLKEEISSQLEPQVLKKIADVTKDEQAYLHYLLILKQNELELRNNELDKKEIDSIKLLRIKISE
jgi:hypothetical protein